MLGSKFGRSLLGRQALIAYPLIFENVVIHTDLVETLAASAI